MTVRVALISDLHGNELALRAALARIDQRGADVVVCLGDVATLGARPHEVLALVRERCALRILGNHDEFLTDRTVIERYPHAPIIRDAVDWCRAELTGEELAFVATFAPTAEIDLGGGARLLLFHGSPRSHMEDLLATTPAEALDAALGDHRAAVLAGGHTHLQMLRQHRGALLVNPGSVGMPFREHAAGGPPVILPHAELAFVDAEAGAVRVTLERIPLDRAALRAQALSVAHPLGPPLAASYA